MTKLSQHKTIRWGIIGLGNIAHKFAKDLLTVSNAQLYAVASRSQDKADEFAATYKAMKAYGCYEDLVHDKHIDAVYIATPHALHKETTLLCLENGLAVLCEKPFAMNSHEVHKMIACAKANNTLLMEALWTRFLPHYTYVLNLLNNKTYGHILKLEASFGFFREFNNNSRLFNKSLGGGSLLDIGIYPIFTALSTLGKPDSIEAYATFFDNGADASCDMIFSYKNNVKAHLKSSLLEPLPTEAIFYCETATIKINTMFHMPTTVSIIIDDKEELLDFNYQTIGYNFEIIHFNELLQLGKTESPMMSFEFSNQLIASLDAVRALIKLEYY
ncbi:MAG: Gfo/Idh/MocA family oxidoreductase [Flavobacteriaceae bacterium]|jgi:predicted dehydrogenase|nr:Gfo/Idh/MocA family oxidoreductase [Flavobacteriaceae bacterium]